MGRGRESGDIPSCATWFQEVTESGANANLQRSEGMFGKHLEILSALPDE